MGEYTLIRGRVLRRENDVVNTDAPILGAVITHRSSNISTLSNSAGDFELKIPHEFIEKQSYIYILSPRPGYRYHPRKIVLEDQPENLELLPSQTSLAPIQALPWPLKDLAFSNYFVGRILDRYILSSTQVVVVSLLLFLIAFLTLLDLGLDIPKTDLDDHWREIAQKVSWIPSTKPIVRFDKVRETYYPGIVYEIITNNVGYDVEYDVLIMDGSTVNIRPGVKLNFLTGKGMNVSGKLIAEGTSLSPIYFQAANDTWSNITIEGNFSTGTTFSYCNFISATGRCASGHENSGSFSIGSGSPVGGAILAYNTQITVKESKFVECSARYGGAVYLRNAEESTLSGSGFSNVFFENCVAQMDNEDLCGGGAIYVKNTKPEFNDCTFKKNSTKGASSCGGAVYLGIGAQANFKDCRFLENAAEAEGGAIYLYNAGLSREPLTSGLVVLLGKFSGNKAHARGGAISGHNSRIYCSEVLFDQNTVIHHGLPDGSNRSAGGAIHLQYNNKYNQRDVNYAKRSSIVNSRFTSNKCEIITFYSKPQNWFYYAGGAVSVAYGKDLSSVPILIEYSYFDSNKASFAHHISAPVSSDAYIKHNVYQIPDENGVCYY